MTIPASEPEPGHALPVKHTNRLTRRTLIRAGSLGGGTLALAGAGFAAGDRLATAAIQIDATPPAVPDFAPAGPAGETIADRAMMLDYDIEKIFRFVADEIHYESYAGVLRGATGTLWARAGNSADQATLLGELLTAAQVPFRFATGELPPDATARLAGLIAPSIEAVRQTQQTAFSGSLQTPGSDGDATPTALTTEEQGRVDQATRQADDLRDRAATLIDATIATVSGALTRASVTLPPISEPVVHELERSKHTWVQIADGPAWTDLDATFPEAQQGTSVTTPVTTANVLPDDLLHIVRIKLAAEEVISGYPTRRDVLSFESASHRLINTPIAIAMTGQSDMNGVGLTINDIFSGTVTFVPCLIAGSDVVTASTPMVFGAGEGAGLIGALDAPGDNALADGETIGVWLVAEVVGPDGIPLTIERTLLDRVGFAARATGVIDLGMVSPLTFVPDQNGQQTVPELAGFTLVTVDVARMPSLYAVRDTQSADLFGQLHLFGPSFASLRNSLAFEHGLAAGFDSYPGGPNLTAFSVHLVDPSDQQAGMEIATDLLIQQPSIVAVGDRSPDPAKVSPFLVSGVLNQVAEQVLMEPLVATADGSDVNLVSPTVGVIFEEAERAGIGITAVATADGLARMSHSDDARARMQAALDVGQVVVVPDAPVTIGGEAVSGWWLVDPVTGRTSDQVEDGRGFAGGRVTGNHVLANAQTATGYAKLLNNVRLWAAPFLALGKCVGAVVASAVAASDFGGTSDGTDAAAEVLKNIDPKGLAEC